MSSRRAVVIVAMTAGTLGLVLCFLLESMSGNAASDAAAPGFVGSDTCAGCHQAQANMWQGSQHKLAMQHASDKSVLGDFNDTSFDYNGVHSRFFRKDGKFFTETDGPDGTSWRSSRSSTRLGSIRSSNI
jgi:cytochrome c554/c'-like protein